MAARIDRRMALAMGGSAVVGAAIGGVSVGAMLRPRDLTSDKPAKPRARATFADWRRDREAPYFVGHRGAGDVAPEHTLPSYQEALDWGTEVIEISVVRSVDDVLFCMHDLTLDRTTNAKGPANQRASAELQQIRVTVPRLGPRWAGREAPHLPRLHDVLEALGGQAVLAIEAKDDSAYPGMIKLIEDASLSDTVMIKMTAANPRLAMAKASAYPVFAYLGSAEGATPAAIERAGRALNPESDALILPPRSDKGLLPADLVRRAVNTGVPIWMAPVHRRHEVQHFSHLGVEGFVTPDAGYLSGVEPRRQIDNWASGGISPGELTRDPYSDTFALQWEEEGVIGLDAGKRPSFLSLGQFCPIQAESYRIAFDATFDPLPSDTWQHMSIAFGHRDDRYYEHRLGDADGYHAVLRAGGNMAIFAHVEGDPNGRAVTSPRSSTPLRPGLWSRLTLDVTPDLIRWSRDDGTSVEVRDPRFRGGYFHIGRSGTDGMLKLRNLTVT